MSKKKEPDKKRNIQSDGIAEDLIRAFVQIGCAEGHTKTLIEKYQAQLENDITESPDKTFVELNDLIGEMNTLAEIRRSIMLRLFNMYEGNKDYWCLVKHLGVAAYEILEAYMASEDDTELYSLYIEANKRFVKAMTYFLGMEITECSACFADFLKGENHVL